MTSQKLDWGRRKAANEIDSRSGASLSLCLLHVLFHPLLKFIGERRRFAMLILQILAPTNHRFLTCLQLSFLEIGLRCASYTSGGTRKLE